MIVFFNDVSAYAKMKLVYRKYLKGVLMVLWTHQLYNKFL